MPKQFQGMGVTFLYPDNWTLETDQDPEAREGSATVFSPSGAFLSVSVYPRRADPGDLAEQAVAGIKEEYGEVDVEVAEESVTGRNLAGYDVNFFCMDLTSTAKVRCLRTDKATYAVFCQAEDTDFERFARVFQAITASLLGSL